MIRYKHSTGHLWLRLPDGIDADVVAVDVVDCGACVVVVRHWDFSGKELTIARSVQAVCNSISVQ